MYKIRIALLALVFISVTAQPVLAASDDVNVTISVPEVTYLDAGADVTLTATVADLNQAFIFSQDASVLNVRCNAAWTLFAQLDSDFTDYALWVEDNRNFGHPTGGGFNPIPAAPASGEMSMFVNYGNPGDRTYNLDWLATGLSWTSYQGDQQRTVTFTLTS